MIGWFLSPIGRWLAGAGALLAAVAGALFAVRRSGRKDAEQERQSDRIEAIQNQKEVRDEVDGMDDYRARSELDRWVRKDDG